MQLLLHPLTTACKYGNKKIVEFLIEKGADIPQSALTEACRAEYFYDSNLEEALTAASGRGNTEVIKLLIENGVEDNTRKTIFLKASKFLFCFYTKETMQLLFTPTLTASEKADAFIDACKTLNKDAIEVLIEDGIDISTHPEAKNLSNIILQRIRYFYYSSNSDHSKYLELSKKIKDIIHLLNSQKTKISGLCHIYPLHTGII